MVHFVTALHCEAQPLIHHHRMKPRGRHGRAQFFEGEEARLVVTGVGALSSAIAVTAMGERFPSVGAFWLNVGLCGAADAKIGTPFLANRIASSNSPEIFYPPLPWKSPWPGIAVKTLNSPSAHYETGWAFDMEAFGFYTAALAFASAEYVQSVKIVSDNSTSPAGEPLDKLEVSRLVEAAIPEIEQFASRALDADNRLDWSPWAQELQRQAEERYRLTETEKHQLSRRLLQWDSLASEHEKPSPAAVFVSYDKKRFLAELQSRIDQLSTQKVC